MCLAQRWVLGYDGVIDKHCFCPRGIQSLALVLHLKLFLHTLGASMRLEAPGEQARSPTDLCPTVPAQRLACSRCSANVRELDECTDGWMSVCERQNKVHI